MTEIQVTAVVKYRKPFSGNLFTKLMPMTAPMSTNGMVQASSANDVAEMLCQANTCSGIFR